MSPRTTEQFAAIRRKSRQAIVDASLRLFARKGYSETTMSDIARQVGISKGLIYNYFSGKEQILECIVDQFVANVIRDPLPNPPVRNPAGYLERLIRSWFAMVRDHPGLMSLGTRLHTDPALKKLIRRKQVEYEKSIIPHITDVFRQLGSGDPEAEMMLLSASLDGIALNYTISPGTFPIQKIERHLVRQYCGHNRRVQ